jgi:hypothetical protein
VNGIRIVTSAAADFHVGMSLPFIFQRQLPDLGVQRFEIRTSVPFLGARREHLGSAFQQLGAPLPDLVRVDLELLGELDHGFIALDRGQRHFRFERC